MAVKREDKGYCQLLSIAAEMALDTVMRKVRLEKALKRLDDLLVEMIRPGSDEAECIKQLNEVRYELEELGYYE
ncbi:hypothetical protein D1872_51240 [compost metagenome]